MKIKVGKPHYLYSTYIWTKRKHYGNIIDYARRTLYGYLGPHTHNK
jgi:hypothetical protein